MIQRITVQPRARPCLNNRIDQRLRNSAPSFIRRDEEIVQKSPGRRRKRPCEGAIMRDADRATGSVERDQAFHLMRWVVEPSPNRGAHLRGLRDAIERRVSRVELVPIVTVLLR